MNIGHNKKLVWNVVKPNWKYFIMTELGNLSIVVLKELKSIIKDII
jgi:hypothetical protein